MTRTTKIILGVTIMLLGAAVGHLATFVGGLFPGILISASGGLMGGHLIGLGIIDASQKSTIEKTAEEKIATTTDAWIPPEVVKALKGKVGKWVHYAHKHFFGTTKNEYYVDGKLITEITDLDEMEEE